VAVEAGGSWYWFIDELEEEGLEPRLVNPLEARKRMGGNKTDSKDAAGLARLRGCGSFAGGIQKCAFVETANAVVLRKDRYLCGNPSGRSV
jgi:transposase